jgi:hypothetical protein
MAEKTNKYTKKSLFVVKAMKADPVVDRTRAMRTF